MSEIRALVVDDSSLTRDLIIAMLSTDERIKVVGEAENGLQAVDMAGQLKPDIILMDIEMPVMDGIEAIEKIMAFNAVPILVITSQGDANVAYTAISKGALEVLPKSDIDPDTAWKLIAHVVQLSKVKVVTHIGGKDLKFGKPRDESRDFNRVVAIASSTGGPRTLSELLPALPEDFNSPIVICQHIADGFAHGFISWLNEISNINVKMAEDGEPLTQGTAYISPPERHMIIGFNNKISFIERKSTDVYHPSCDMLLSSVASIYKSKSIGIVLSGMGKDGAIGVQRIKQEGGKTMAQDEATSIIFGMPNEAIKTGFVDMVLPSSQIGTELMKLCMFFHTGIGREEKETQRRYLFTRVMIAPNFL